MKKRGGNKRSSANHRKAAKKATKKAARQRAKKRPVKRKAAKTSVKRKSSARKAKPVKKRTKASSSKSIVADQLWELKESRDVLASEEKGIRHWISSLSAREAFHYVSFFISLVLLALLLNSDSLIFYIVLTGAVLLFAGFLQRHHRPHPIMNIIAIFFVPLILTLALFRDSFVWLLGVVYTIAVVSTIIIYHHQKRVKGKIHDPLKIMWQVTYSKIVAVTVTAILAAALPKLLFGTKFVSMFELSLLYILPLALVFFFMSKFLYLYFFDRQHVKLDIMKSLHYMIIYTIAFLVVFICIYSIFAVTLYNKEMGNYNKALNDRLYDSNALKEVMDAQPEEIANLRVSMELKNYLDGHIAELGAEKNAASSAQISFGAILDDSYLAEISESNFNILRQSIDGAALAWTKMRISDYYQQMAGMTDSELNTRTAALKAVFENIGYTQDSKLEELFALIDNPGSDSDDFEDNGLFWIFSKEGGVEGLYYPDSIFEGELIFVLKHTQFFRAVTTVSVKNMLYVMDQQQAHNLLKTLINNRDTPENTLSKAIRYSIIVEDLQE